jgi:hypothetical protein
MVVQTECMSIVNAASSGQTKAPSPLRAHHTGDTSVDESGNAGHSVQTLVEVSSTSPPMVKRQSVQLLDARTLEDPAGTLMSSDEALVISNFEQINVNQLKREASGIGLTTVSPSASDSSRVETLPAAKEPVKTRQARETSTDDGVRKLISELCDAPPSGSFKSFQNAFSDQTLKEDESTSIRPGSFSHASADDDQIQCVAGSDDISARKDSSFDVLKSATDEVNRDIADSFTGKGVTPAKRRASLGQPLALSSATQTPLTGPIIADTECEKPWGEDRNGGGNIAQQEAFATDEHMLHLDSNFESEGSRVDFENNTTKAVLANDFDGDESQVAEIDAIRHAIPGGSAPDPRVSDSGGRLEKMRGMSAEAAPQASSGGSEKKSDGFYEVF